MFHFKLYISFQSEISTAKSPFDQNSIETIPLRVKIHFRRSSKKYWKSVKLVVHFQTISLHNWETCFFCIAGVDLVSSPCTMVCSFFCVLLHMHLFFLVLISNLLNSFTMFVLSTTEDKKQFSLFHINVPKNGLKYVTLQPNMFYLFS